MSLIILLLLVAAFVLFLLATFGVGSRFNLIAAGLACWVLTAILPALHG